MKNMKSLLKIFVMSLCLCFVAACNDDDEVVAEPYMEVTAHNIAGEWMLSEWRGEELPDGSFVYLELERQDRHFTIYQNIDSFDVRIATGTFNIVEDERLGFIIRGIYDNTMSAEWSHRYIVTELSADRMVWTAMDDTTDVSVYIRTEIPDFSDL